MVTTVATPTKTGDNRATVLIVDDDPGNVVILGELLQPHYDILVAPSGKRAVEIVTGKTSPDLILLDVMMPEMDGYEVLRQIRKHPGTHDIPVIFITGMDAVKDEETGLALGAVDYITKPFSPAIVLARVRTHLELKQARDWLSDQNVHLEAEVARRTSDILLTQDITIRALAELAETRDNETGNHIRRTQEYVGLLAHRLQKHPRFADFLSDQTVGLLAKSAPLHDIGKVGIPDRILLKPGKLTAEEWAVMQTHAALGAQAIERALRETDRHIDFLDTARQIAQWHHEKWDGSGYPDGLKEDAIPVPARLMALADVFDALISRRVYKAALPAGEARDIIAGERGRHFDPDVTDAFLAAYDDFVAVADRYREGGAA